LRGRQIDLKHHERIAAGDRGGKICRRLLVEQIGDRAAIRRRDHRRRQRHRPELAPQSALGDTAAAPGDAALRPDNDVQATTQALVVLLEIPAIDKPRIEHALGKVVLLAPGPPRHPSTSS